MDNVICEKHPIWIHWEVSVEHTLYQLALRISNICCSISPSHTISVEVYSWALMSRSRKKTYSASLSWHRLKTFLSLTSELHHWYRVADPVLQSRHQKEDKYQVNAFPLLSTLKTNKFITACFSVCSICKWSFSESALCTPSHTSRAEPDKRSLSKT